MKGYAKLPLPDTFTVERSYLEGLELPMYKKYHPYKSGPGRGAIHYHARENGKLIAVFSFKPPAMGAAKKYNPSDPHSIVCLSRMAAVPKEERQTKHISKIMRRLWSDLPSKYKTVVSYSDSSCDHNGFVYLCSGFKVIDTSYAKYYVNAAGERVSVNTCGKRNPDAIFAGSCALTVWSLAIPGR